MPMNLAQPRCRRETSRGPAQVEKALLLPSAEWVLRMAAIMSPQGGVSARREATGWDHAEQEGCNLLGSRV